MLTEAINKRIAFLLVAVGPLASLLVSPTSNFDPINLVKLLFVTAIAFSILSLLIASGVREIFQKNKIMVLSLFGFILWMLLVLVVSDSPVTQQLFGVFGRNTGFFTYSSLAILALAASLMQSKSFYTKLVWALLGASVPMTIYAILQIAGKDPIGWSEMAPFATLGNINFSSAFFGLASLCSIVMSLNKDSKAFFRVTLLLLAVIQMLIVLETGSIQGIMIFFAGVGIASFLYLRSNFKLRVFQIPLVFLGVASFSGVVAALFNVGPLARFIFQNSILFRFDYWHAGWEMTLRNPFFGVGLDSYGDWYREVRGEISTLRTGPDRITNTAHNIYLDLSASGGLPLLFFYAVFLGIAARSAIRVIRRNSSFDPIFVAIFSAWVAYLIQAAVSINQVGVGIWGWLFTGALIGYEKFALIPSKIESKRSFKSTPGSSQLTASVALVSIGGFALGFLVALIPFNADSKFKDALQAGDVMMQFQASKALGATAYHMELALDSAIKANNEVLAAEITDELVKRYPRDFMAWRVKQVLSTSTPDERIEAYEMLKVMDPFNPDIQPTQ